jgi:molybdopterin-guanine dinucleotide biosynthesis protein A
VHVSLAGSLHDFINMGQHKTGLWARSHRHAQVLFEDATEFLNVNTLIELEQARSAL